MSPGMTLFSVQAVLILSTEDGSRIFAKYYSSPHSAAPGTSIPRIRTLPPRPLPRRRTLLLLLLPLLLLRRRRRRRAQAMRLRASIA